jgi:hypothetical protein
MLSCLLRCASSKSSGVEVPLAKRVRHRRSRRCVAAASCSRSSDSALAAIPLYTPLPPRRIHIGGRRSRQFKRTHLSLSRAVGEAEKLENGNCWRGYRSGTRRRWNVRWTGSSTPWRRSRCRAPSMRSWGRWT